MKRLTAWFISLAMLAMPVMASDAQQAVEKVAEKADASEADKERIRLLVKEVLREYAATLGDKQASPVTKEIMKSIVRDNAAFMRSHGVAHFARFMDSQHPRATVITCSDSRVHTHALDANPDNDLFMIRNIGNQIATAEGSVEYGVHHLHTPLLLIVGHTACGAIKAAASDYSKESGPIRYELDTIQIPKGEPGMSSIKLNVNNQVRRAMEKWEEEVITGKLTVVGAIYDFRNELNQGHGKLVVVNVNGETDAKRIAAMELMKEANAPEPKGRKPKAMTEGRH